MAGHGLTIWRIRSTGQSAARCDCGETWTTPSPDFDEVERPWREHCEQLELHQTS
ncbi:hypothetical protein [Saccharopolyspora cebuensis]|uniref:hypothetical protein n=1 Tax=Saccharopolyspora cebuensis TaxID=418759 RepID=UPI0031EC51C1